MTLSLLNEIKIEIRSLLISSQNGLSEDELCRDYSLFNSKRSLPYQIFGYSSITDFLNSLNDILYRSSDGFIYPIVDQSTEHIFKFVQQQRKKKKTKQKPICNNQQSKPAIPRNKRRRPIPSITPSQQIYSTVDAIKQMKMTYRDNIKNQGSFCRLKLINNDSSPKFERINVTNEFLQGLLNHFRQHQHRQ